MNPTLSALQAGIRRGGIELRQTLTNFGDLWGHLFLPGVFLIVMFFLRGRSVPGTNVTLGTMIMPSVLGMQIALNGLATVAGVLILEREDGTLLRAKATPNGMLGYLVGKIVQISGTTLISLALILVPSLFIFDGLAADSLGSWFTLAWVLLLGLVATLPIGAIFGSLFSSPGNMGIIMLPMIGLTAISGIFYPITSFPLWLQWIAQVFPIYWLGLGMRSALLPHAQVSVELGQSWRHLETAGVLGLWAIIGLALAPIILRHMARHESGSSVAARREKAMQRVR